MCSACGYDLRGLAGEVVRGLGMRQAIAVSRPVLVAKSSLLMDWVGLTLSQRAALIESGTSVAFV